MRKLIDDLVEGYRSHHDTNATLLEWIGVVGVIAFPVLYLLRFTGNLPPLYDDLGFRLVAAGLCLLLALRRWWPAKLRPYYLGSSYLTVFYCLAFFLPFTLLQNKAATPSVANMGRLP
jgi:two-component system, CAI-1 autoinducer sensor kinase/phosphatase CqsS